MAPRYDDLIGTPFKYKGRGPDVYDCYGLLMEMMRRDGVEIPDVLSPEIAEQIASLIAVESFKWEELDSPKEGCAIIFRVKGFASHVGYYLGNDRFIHTWEKSGGVCVERLSQWKNRVIDFLEYKNSGN